MSAAGILDLGARRLDDARAAVLRRLGKLRWFRRLFRDRPRRQAWTIGLASAVALGAAALWPIWMLALGPAIWGYAHLGASLRYVTRATAAGERRRQAAGLAVGVALIYLALKVVGVGTTTLSEWQGAGLPEAALIAGGAAALGWAAHPSKRRTLLALLTLAPLVYALLAAPWITIGALVLLHNIVGYLYWTQAAQGPGRRAALFGLALMLGGSALIFAGGLDASFPSSLADSTAPVAWASLGALITPWTDDPIVGMRAVAALAFGQALHYTVWLKCLPDEAHRHQAPTTFRQSLGLLRGEWSPSGATTAVTFVALGTATWLTLGLDEGRQIYLLLAGFHGYLEIAGLPLLTRP